VLRSGGIRDAFSAGEQSVQVVEASVLRVDHDDMFDARESSAVGGRGRRGAAAERQKDDGADDAEQAPESVPRRLLLHSTARQDQRSPTGCAGSHSSTLLPSGSTNQPKRPYSCSSTSPTTRPPPRWTWPSAPSRSSTM